MDVYFFVRNEETNNWVAISGDGGHRGRLDQWPYVQHSGDSRGPNYERAALGRPGREQVMVRPDENGQMLVNIYQSVDNGSGAIDTFGRPRVVVRYGPADANGRLNESEASEITTYVGNGRHTSYWHASTLIDVQDGELVISAIGAYSKSGERMPVLDSKGKVSMKPHAGPIGQSKRNNDGQGLTHYEGTCESPTPVRGLL